MQANQPKPLKANLQPKNLNLKLENPPYPGKLLYSIIIGTLY